MSFFRWLFHPFDQPYVSNWTPERAKYYEVQTMKAAGRVVEPVYTWSKKVLEDNRPPVAGGDTEASMRDEHAIEDRSSQR